MEDDYHVRKKSNKETKKESTNQNVNKTADIIKHMNFNGEFSVSQVQMNMIHDTTFIYLDFNSPNFLSQTK